MSLLFWARVNQLIRELRTKQEWIAAKAGINYNTLKGWINKDVLPRADDAAKIAAALGVTVEYLLDGRTAALAEEADQFYLKYRKHSILLEYLEDLTFDQREDLEAFALVLMEKNRALKEKSQQ